MRDQGRGASAGAGLALATLLAGCGLAGGGGSAAPSTTAPASPPAPTSVSPSASASTRPGAPEREPLRFSAVGDIGNREDSGMVLDAIAARRDDLTVAVGDLSYDGEGTESAWCRFVTRRLGAEYPFEIVAGNHEDDGPDGSIDAFRRCLPNHLPDLVGDYGKEWYADVPADDPLVRFVMVSPDLDFQHGLDGAGPQHLSYEKGTPEYAWTRSAVEGAHDAGIPWVVVGMHKPCLSVGVYDCQSGPDLMNLLLKERVDLVVAGHEHMYQRTKPVALGPGCATVRPDGYDSACLARGDARGTTFVTVGNGGRELRKVNPGDPERRWFAAVSAADLDPTYGSLSVELTEDRLTARFEPVGGGSFTDAFVLRR